MQVFEKIIEKIEGLKVFDPAKIRLSQKEVGELEAYDKAIKVIKKVAVEYNNGWIPVSERLPKCETDVYIQAKRKYRDGSIKNIVTVAMYEDGTVLDKDSCWYWEDIDGKWDEENDCLIIPEGWYESKQYNPDGVLNYAVSDEVIAWQPLPEQYK